MAEAFEPHVPPSDDPQPEVRPGELPGALPASPLANPDHPAARSARQLLAGVLAERKLAPKDAVRRWQAAVQSGDFDADRAATELLDGGQLDAWPNAAAQRSSGLLRDLLMSSKLTGGAGAARKAREAGRGFFAYLLTQLGITAVFALLFAAGLLLARAQGVALDPLLDQLLGRDANQSVEGESE
jgi:hypothetical protein